MPKASDRSRFEVVDGGAPTRTKRRPGGKQWECTRCQHDIGIATSMTIVVRVCPVVDNRGKVTGGTIEEVCAACLMRGVHIRVGVSGRNR